MGDAWKRSLTWLAAATVALVVWLGGCGQAPDGEQIGWIVMTGPVNPAPVSIRDEESVRALTEKFSSLQWQKTERTGDEADWPEVWEKRLTWFSPEGRRLGEVTVWEDGLIGYEEELYCPVDGEFKPDLGRFETEGLRRDEIHSYLETKFCPDVVGVYKKDEERGILFLDPELVYEVDAYLYSLRYEKIVPDEPQATAAPAVLEEEQVQYSIEWAFTVGEEEYWAAGSLDIVDEKTVRCYYGWFTVLDGGIDLAWLADLTDPEGSYAGREGVRFFEPEPLTPEELAWDMAMGIGRTYDIQNPHGPTARAWLPYDPEEVAWAVLDNGIGKRVAVTEGVPLQVLLDTMSLWEFLQYGYYCPPLEQAEGSMTLTLYDEEDRELAVLSINEDWDGNVGQFASGGNLALHGVWQWLLNELPAMDEN